MLHATAAVPTSNKIKASHSLSGKDYLPMKKALLQTIAIGQKSSQGTQDDTNLQSMRRLGWVFGLRSCENPNVEHLGCRLSECKAS